MNVIFLGSGDIGLPSLRWLLDAAGTTVSAVVTQPDRAAGRGLQVRLSAIKELAVARGIPVLQPSKVRDPKAIAEIASYRPDLLVVMAYGQILPQSLLDVPRVGALNLHASLLPRHRGAAPVHAAILAGDAKSGVTVMWMDAGLDTGDILLSCECAISPDETAGTLHDKLADLAPQALATAWPLLCGGKAPHEPQDVTQATYAPKLNRALGRLDWEQSAAEIARKIRGLHPWPGCTARVEVNGGKILDLKIHRAAEVGGAAAVEDLRFACAGGGVLQILELQPAGGQRMSAEVFLRGHRVLRAVRA
jgi:methionyl-tRNA formyltransferase